MCRHAKSCDVASSHEATELGLFQVVIECNNTKLQDINIDSFSPSLLAGCLTDEYNFYTIGADKKDSSGGLLIANLTATSEVTVKN